MRQALVSIYRAGLARVRGFDAVAGFFSQNPLSHTMYLVAAGKAASSMTLGAVHACPDKVADGLVITKHGHLEQELADDGRFRCIESDHPVPGENTLQAGRVLTAYLKARAAPGAYFLFLLSGGASSLVEILPEGMTLQDLETVNQGLLSSGMDIAQMNAVRRSFSQIKGGRLAGRLEGCHVLNLLVSDVPGDDPAVIGSGLLTPSRDTIDLSHCPRHVRQLLERFDSVETPDDASFDLITTHVIACLDDAKQCALEHAQQHGFDAALVPEFLQGDAETAATRICRQLSEQRGRMLIWGGETSVVLPSRPGRGGRNQHLALAAASLMQGKDGFYLLAAGSDGTDGPTQDAGGLIDGGTVARGTQAGFDAAKSLHCADSGTFLEASDDLLQTGPTGTNVMDLAIGIYL